MTQMIAQLKIADYPSWRKFFDEHESFRASYGQQSSRIFQATDNPNDVMIYFEWDSEAHARSFIGSDELKKVMKEAGVVGPPTFHYIGNSH